MKTDLTQRLLPFQNRNKFTISTFISSHTINFLKLSETLNSSESQQTFLFQGLSGYGKTHILQSLCNESYHHGLRCQYWPLKSLNQDLDKMLEGSECCDLICLDDIHVLMGHPKYEECIFNLLNKCQCTGTNLAISVLPPLNKLSCKLPDLKSRLSGMLYIPLKPMSDEEKSKALFTRSQHLGIEVPAALIQYLINHSSRDNTQLFTVIDALIDTCLIEKRRPTLPLLKAVLQKVELSS
jgi:DnaA-homolog protein